MSVASAEIGPPGWAAHLHDACGLASPAITSVPKGEDAAAHGAARVHQPPGGYHRRGLAVRRWLGRQGPGLQRRRLAATGCDHRDRFALYANRWAPQEIAAYAACLLIPPGHADAQGHAWPELQPYRPMRHTALAAGRDTVRQPLAPFVRAGLVHPGPALA